MTVYKKLPDSTEVGRYNNLGIKYCKNKQFDEGIANFNNAIRLNPDIPQLYINRSIAFTKLGFHYASLADLEIAQNLVPSI